MQSHSYVTLRGTALGSSLRIKRQLEKWLNDEIRLISIEDEIVVDWKGSYSLEVLSALGTPPWYRIKYVLNDT